MSPDRAALEKSILRAAAAGDAAAVAQLLAADPTLVGARSAAGTTPLHRAAFKGHLAVAELLLDHGADPNLQDEGEHYGGTSLHAAAHANQRALVALLLARGADPSVVSPNGRTPLQETDYHKATAAAKLIREHVTPA